MVEWWLGLWVYKFGHYVPFLGAFFGINVLFGAWDGVYGKLYSESVERAKKAEEQWENDTATLDISGGEREKLKNKRWWNNQFREGIKTGGRIIGRIIAGTIAATFFIVPREISISGWAVFCIALAAVLPILALALMWLNNKGLINIENRADKIYREADQNRKKMDTQSNETINAVEEKIEQSAGN